MEFTCCPQAGLGVYFLTDVFVLLSPKTHRKGWGVLCGALPRVYSCIPPSGCWDGFQHPRQRAPPPPPADAFWGRWSLSFPPWFQALLFRVSRQLHPSGWCGCLFLESRKMQNLLDRLQRMLQRASKQPFHLSFGSRDFIERSHFGAF